MRENPPFQEFWTEDLELDSGSDLTDVLRSATMFCNGCDLLNAKPNSWWYFSSANHTSKSQHLYTFSQTDYVFCPVYEIPFAQPWGSREELKQGKHVWVDCKEGLEGAELLRWSGFLFLEVSTEPIGLSENKIPNFFNEKSMKIHGLSSFSIIFFHFMAMTPWLGPAKCFTPVPT